jgi:glutathione S-transferase
MSGPVFILYVDHFWVSPYAFCASSALHEKGLDFEVRTVDLDRGEQRGAGYASLSLTARVPTLVHGDFTLSESSAIVEYLDELYPERPRLLPNDVRQRARARQIMAFLRSDLGALREERTSNHAFYPPQPLPPLSAAGQAAADKIVRVASALVSAGSTTAFGDAWSIADQDLAMMLMRLVRTGASLPSGLVTYAEAQWDRPSARPFIERSRPPYVASP